MGLTYKEAGVDVVAADRLVQFLRRKAPGIGGFTGLFPVRAGGRKAYLAATTDGVGTKLKLAFLLDQHETVGIDLVAMCVNDLITCGAKPLFFMDYYATGRLDVEKSKRILEGILEGCRQAGMALLGGETAEMPGFYPGGEYDLAGFAVGWVEPGDLLNGSRLRAGDVLAALPSSGLHSNGFSLVRRVFSREQLLKEAKELLEPTRIYARQVRRLHRAVGKGLKGLAHITGEGLAGNVPRMLAKGFRAVVHRRCWEVPEIFRKIQRLGGISEEEMWAVFNMGVGMVVLLDPASVPAASKALPELFVIGHIERGSGKDFVFSEAINV